MQGKDLREARLKVGSPGGRGWAMTWIKASAVEVERRRKVWEVKLIALDDHIGEERAGKEKILNDTDSGLADLVGDGGINRGREHRRKSRCRMDEEVCLGFTMFEAGSEHPRGNIWVRQINLELRERREAYSFESPQQIGVVALTEVWLSPKHPASLNPLPWHPGSGEGGLPCASLSSPDHCPSLLP